MKQFLDTIMPYIILGVIAIVAYKSFTGQKNTVTEQHFEQKQEILQSKIDSIQAKLDSLQIVRKEIHESKTVIIQKEAEQKNEVYNTNDIDSLNAMLRVRLFTNN